MVQARVGGKLKLPCEPWRRNGAHVSKSSCHRELPLQSKGVFALEKAVLVRERRSKVVPRKCLLRTLRPCQGGGRILFVLREPLQHTV